MAVRETVRILRLLMEGDRADLRQQYGAEAVALAQDMQRVLEERLQDESAYASLWDVFVENPQDNAPKLTGALGAMIEADPALGRRLNAFIEAFHEVVGPPGASVPDLTPDSVTTTDTVPDTTETSGETYDDDAGAYLRGNVTAGSAALAQEAGASRTELGRGRSVFRDPTALATLPEFFDELHDAIDAYPKGDAADKKKLHDAVGEIQAALADETTTDSDIDLLRQQIATIEALAPEVSDDLQRRLDQLHTGQQPQRQQP